MGSFQKRVAAFRGRFFAATSAKSRACKREEITKLARAVKGGANILPLSRDTVEAVAAALKESGMRSGAQYLVELKLLHIEAGYEVEAWLKRTLDVCKKGLESQRTHSQSSGSEDCDMKRGRIGCPCCGQGHA